MAWSPFCLLLIFSYSSGSIGQYVLTQPTSVSVSLGETARITCSGDLVSKEYVHWYQQKPNSAPRLIIYKDDQRPDDVSDRFSGNSAGNTATLTISNVQLQDEADYYCQHYHKDSSTQYIFGDGTALSVLGQPASPPTVNLFPPSADEIQSKNKATLVCLMDGFIPGAVTVTWQADGATITSGVETTKPTKVNDKYMAASYLSMDKAEWERSEKYSCKVTHAGTEYPKAINRSQCA